MVINSPVQHYSKATADLLKKIYSFKFIANLSCVSLVLAFKVSNIFDKYSLSSESFIILLITENSSKLFSTSDVSKTPSLGSAVSALSKG